MIESSRAGNLSGTIYYLGYISFGITFEGDSAEALKW